MRQQKGAGGGEAGAECIESKTVKVEKESVFTDVQASTPNTNSFRVSSLPTCPYAYVCGGRLNHLLMSFPPLSLTITLRNSMVSDSLLLLHVQYELWYRAIITYTNVMLIGLKHKLPNNGYKASKTGPQTPTGLFLQAEYNASDSLVQSDRTVFNTYWFYSMVWGTTGETTARQIQRG